MTSYPPMEPFPRPEPDPGPADGRDQALERSSRWGLVAVVLVFAGGGVALSASTGRLDSALLFVGIPSVLAILVAWLPIDREGDGWGTVFQVLTVLLLCASALLHEGALCVLIAAPLVYGAAAIGYAGVLAVRRHQQARMAAFPVLALLALEGLLPGLRVAPEQVSDASALVAEDCASFEEALARGPRIEQEDRGLLLGLAQYPTPVAATGGGLRVGDTWQLQMPAGAITTRVRESTVGRITFDVVDDTARTTRWVDLHTGTLAWQQSDEGCRATMSIDYTRKLDPSFWFGPVTDLFMGAGAEAFLAGLD